VGYGYRFLHRDFFAFEKADHAAILEYAPGKWWSRRYSDVPMTQG